MRSARYGIERAQRRWADAAGVAHDARGYVRDLAANLRVPLDAAMRAELDRGQELMPSSTRPARIAALWSSAALVWNFFSYWRERDSAPLAAALGVSDGRAELRFEEPLPTGLEGDPPTTDVALLWPTGRIAAVESKFGEWLVRRPRNKIVLKDKYFPQGRRVWEEAGLVRCEAFARELQSGRERFKHFHAAQLLKHALGLARGGSRSPVLVYLYYDWPGRESLVHRAEVERFVACIGPEVDLRAVTYQELFARLPAGVDGDYRAYLEARYFRQPPRYG
jgi:hypothetical protein